MGVWVLFIRPVDHFGYTLFPARTRALARQAPTQLNPISPRISPSVGDREPYVSVPCQFYPKSESGLRRRYPYMVVVIFSWPSSKRVAVAPISLCYKPSSISTSSSSIFASSLIRLFKPNTFALTNNTHYRSVPPGCLAYFVCDIYHLYNI